MPLNTHTPTGLAAWPMILVDGPQKVGKSCLAYEVSASPRVGDSFVFAIGERSAEEYGSLGPYKIVDLDGTWAGFYNQLIEATKVPMTDDKPNVIIIDTATGLWTDLRDWVDRRARNSEKNKRILQQDPDAAIDRGQNLWNDANERWMHMLTLLNRWPGITILVARGDEVTEYADGAPTGNLAYRAEVQKTTPYNVTANVRIPTYRAPVLVGVTRLGVEIPKGGLELPHEGALEHLIFEVLGTTVAGSQAQGTTGAAPGGGYSERGAKHHLAQRFRDSGWSNDDLAVPAGTIWRDRYEGVTIDEVPVDVMMEMLAEAQAVIDLGAAPAEPTAAAAPAEAPQEPVSAAPETPAPDPAPTPPETTSEPAAAAPADPRRHCDQHHVYTKGCAACRQVLADLVRSNAPADPPPVARQAGDEIPPDTLAAAQAFVAAAGGDPDGPQEPVPTDDFDEGDAEEATPTEAYAEG